jgi:hypothetical protein
MQPFQLPKMDAILWKDDRSRAYGVRPLLVTSGPPKKTIWQPPTKSFLPLDQGEEGACVGFGWSGELQMPPVEIPVHNQFAQNFYLGARDVDRKEGRFFPEGATVLAGAKYAKRMGWISEYRWCFGMMDLQDSVTTRGPVVLGIPWRAGMYSTDLDGRVWINGETVGGHCILCIGYWPKHPKFGDCYVLLNSWGRSWGINGVGYITEADMRKLFIDEQGEACIARDIVPQPRIPWWKRIADSFK